MSSEASFGLIAKNRRRELGLTQDELARRVGCAPITLRKIEADDLRPSVQIAERMAMALNIPLEERAAFVKLARVDRAPVEEPKVTPMPEPNEIGIDDLTGRAIRGYALGERLGNGGMGVVYRAVQPLVEREVAIKIILPRYANHPDFIRRFEAEAQLVARLEHPHIVPLYDYWREPSVAYLIMRLLRGGSVQSLLRNGSAISPEIVLRMMEQIGSALSSAHRAGVVHRDLKPANVLLDEDNNAYLADFGIAKNLSSPSSDTRADMVLGSPDYISPEQIRSEYIRPQTDIYALGVMLYELLTGKVPFNGPTPFEVMHQHLSTPLPSLAANRVGLPKSLDAVIEHATAKDPLQRYETVDTMVNDLRKALGVSQPEIKSNTLTSQATVIPARDVENPYKGLRAFGEGDAQDFFGREALTQQLLIRLGEGGELARFLAVVGPSGSGKSSVVKAGLIPALRRGALPGSENWFIIEMMPGSHPLEELEAALLRVAVNPPASLIEQFQNDKRGLIRAVRRSLPDDPNIELVLVIDQFEEVFTLLQDENERQQFLSLLVSTILDEQSRVRIVITLRADFIDRPLSYVDFGELMRQRMEIILPLTPDELESAITAPAGRVGLHFESGLVAAILHDLGDQPGTLPLLQYALTELYEKRVGNALTKSAYQEIGGVLGALGRRAEDVFNGLDTEAQIIARQIFLRLVTLGEGVEDTRRRALIAELENLKFNQTLDPKSFLRSVQKVLDTFGSARLLSFDRDPDTRGPTIEVAHEAIIREWARLREWLDESRADVRLQRQLANATVEWQNAKQESSYLLAGAKLEQFEGWAANSSIALTQAERAFLDASISEREKRTAEELTRQRRELEAERQSAIRLRSRNRIVSGALVLAIVLAGVAMFFGNQASRNATAANANEKIAASRELAAAAISNLDDDPERSILLALEAEATVHTIEADNALHRSILTSRVELVLQHDASVWSVAFSPDGKRIATASQDKTAKIWDATTGKLLLTLAGHTDSVNNVIYSPDGKLIATASDDHTAKVWDAITGKELLTMKGHTDAVWRISFSPDGTRLATTSIDHTAKVWDVFTGRELQTFSGHENDVFDIAFNPDGKRIATSGYDGNVRIWDASSGSELLTLPVEGGQQLRGVAFSPDGARVAVAGDGNGYVKIWDATTGKELLSGNMGHTDWLRDIAFSRDGTLAATGGNSQKVNVWDSTTGQVLYTLSGHTSSINGVAFSPDGTRLVTAGWDHTARVWDITPAKEALFIPFANTVTSGWSWWLHYSPDGTRILTDYTDSNARIWDAVTGKELIELKDHDGNAWIASYSLDGKLVATGNEGGSIDIWDAKTGKRLNTLVGHTDNIFQIAFSPDGTRLASSSWDGTVIIFDLASGKELLTFDRYKNIAGNQVAISLAYSPNGKQIVLGYTDGTAFIWDSVTGKKIFDVSLPTGADGETVNSATYSLDGKRVALAGKLGTIRIWDALTGKELLNLRGHTGAVNQITFSPDGKLLASASNDGTARIWDTITGVNLLTLPVDSKGVGGVSFNPDGTRLAVGGNSGISIFVLPIDDVIALAKSRVTRTLTLEECQQYLHTATCLGQ